MFKHVLIATEGSEQGNRVVAGALALAKLVGAKVTVLTATDIMPTGPFSPIPWPFQIEQYEDAARASANRILDRALASARSLEVACDTVHAVDQRAADAIVDTCERLCCDLIVMGAHGHRGLKGALLGSQVHKVLTLSRTPVLVWR